MSVIVLGILVYIVMDLFTSEKTTRGEPLKKDHQKLKDDDPMNQTEGENNGEDLKPKFSNENQPKPLQTESGLLSNAQRGSMGGSKLDENNSTYLENQSLVKKGDEKSNRSKLS